MINTLRSEWIKLRTVRMNLVLFIIAVAFPLIVSVLVASLGDIDDLRASDVVGLVTGSSVVTALLLGVVGASRSAPSSGSAPSGRRSRRRRGVCAC